MSQGPEPTGVAVTRGHGLLELSLARRRAAMADKLIPPSLRTGNILDVGCGSFPYFITQTRFARKTGLDKLVIPDDRAALPGVDLHRFDFHHDDRLPFADASFTVVTMLAVFEHIRLDRLMLLLDEVERVLAPGGVFVMTTPAGWTGWIFHLLKRAGLVSREEIDEHQDSFSHAKIRAIIGRTRLAPLPSRHGYFEAFMNQWMILTKPR